MGNFLLNDFGEVLLEIKSTLDFGPDLLLEIDEHKKTAVLKNSSNEIKLDYVHQDLMLPLKQNRYLFVIERNNQFYACHSGLAKVVFIN